MRTTSRGFGIHYTVDGDGPPLMLVAGTMMSARHWVDPGYVAALAGQWRVITVDPLGHGGSDLPHDADAYTAAGVTADLIAVLDAEGVAARDGVGLLARRMARVQPGRPSPGARRPHRRRRLRHARPSGRGRPDVDPDGGLPARGDWAGVWRKFGIVRHRIPADDGGGQRPDGGGGGHRRLDASHPIRRPRVDHVPRVLLRRIRGLDRAARPGRCARGRGARSMSSPARHISGRTSTRRNRFSLRWFRVFRRRRRLAGPAAVTDVGGRH